MADDATATDTPTADDIAAAQMRAQGVVKEVTPEGKALAAPFVQQYQQMMSPSNPDVASLIQKYGVNADTAKQILMQARNTITSEPINPQRYISQALQENYAPGSIAREWGDVAGGAWQAADAARNQRMQALGIDQQINATDMPAIEAQLKMLTSKYGPAEKMAEKALGIEASPLQMQRQTSAAPGELGQLNAAEAEIGRDKTDPKYLADVQQYIDKIKHFSDPVAQAAAIPQDAKEMFYQSVVATGKPPSGFSRSAPVSAAMWAYAKQRADQDGNTMASMLANGNLRQANTSALTQGMKQESAISSYYDTMDKNLTNLMDLSGKVDSTGSPLVNKVFRAWQHGVTGDPDVAKYVTYLNSVESEFAKIQSGSMGNQAVTDAARKESKDTINKYMGPGTIEAVAEGMRGEGNNRLGSLHDQNTYLKTQLGIKTPSAAPTPGESHAPAGTTAATAPTTSGTPAPRNAKGWALHVDAAGNKAYVGPNNEIEEVH